MSSPFIFAFFYVTVNVVISFIKVFMILLLYIYVCNIISRAQHGKIAHKLIVLPS